MEEETRYVDIYQNQQAAGETSASESLLTKLFDTVLQTGSEVAKTVAAGKYGYQPYEAGPGGVYASGYPANVKAASLGGISISPGMLLLFVVAGVGLYLATR